MIARVDSMGISRVGKGAEPDCGLARESYRGWTGDTILLEG